MEGNGGRETLQDDDRGVGEESIGNSDCVGLELKGRFRQRRRIGNWRMHVVVGMDEL